MNKKKCNIPLGTTQDKNDRNNNKKQQQQQQQQQQEKKDNEKIMATAFPA